MTTGSGSRSRLVRRLTVSVFALVSACSSPPSGRDLFTVSGAVAGVISQGAAPLADVTVVATALYPPPSGALRLTDSTRTGTDGRYLLVLTTLNAPDTVLSATLSIRPPAGTGLPPRDTANVAVGITHVLPPRDTARVDVVY